MSPGSGARRFQLYRHVPSLSYRRVCAWCSRVGGCPARPFWVGWWSGIRGRRDDGRVRPGPVGRREAPPRAEARRACGRRLRHGCHAVRGRGERCRCRACDGRPVRGRHCALGRPICGGALVRGRRRRIPLRGQRGRRHCPRPLCRLRGIVARPDAVRGPAALRPLHAGGDPAQGLCRVTAPAGAVHPGRGRRQRGRGSGARAPGQCEPAGGQARREGGSCPGGARGGVPGYHLGP